MLVDSNKVVTTELWPIGLVDEVSCDELDAEVGSVSWVVDITNVVTVVAVVGGGVTFVAPIQSKIAREDEF